MHDHDDTITTTQFPLWDDGKQRGFTMGRPSHVSRGYHTARSCGAAILVMLVSLALSACATTPGVAGPADADQANDPAEKVNRAVFAGNQFVDKNALQSVARGYRDYLPDQVQKRIGTFVGNLGEPAVAVNDVLQGNFGRAWTTTQRFAVNTIVGGDGLFDVATDWKRPHHNSDFGQTFAVWGAGTGPVVELPLFGSSNVRDSVGAVVGFVANPLTVAGGTVSTVSSVASGLGLVDRKAGLLDTTKQLEHNSLDYYATLRSIAAQQRAALVLQGRTGGHADTENPLPIIAKWPVAK